MNLGNPCAYVGNNPWIYTDPMGLGFRVRAGGCELESGREIGADGGDVAGDGSF